MFQSRNRDACHFRVRSFPIRAVAGYGFNLAIEMLVISGNVRNPDSSVGLGRFNLAIEMLIISGQYMPAFPQAGNLRFNLAIEMLIISGHLRTD